MKDFSGDLYHILNPKEVGDVIVKPNGSEVRGALTLSPIVLSSGETSLSTNTHSLIMRAQDADDLDQGDEIMIGLTFYSISNLIPDEAGGIELTIHRVERKSLL